MRVAAWLWFGGSLTGCYTLRAVGPVPPAPCRADYTFEGQPRFIELRFESDVSEGEHQRACQAIQELGRLRATPAFRDKVASVQYDLRAQPPGRTRDDVVACATESFSFAWRIRSCPWLRFCPFKREVGRSVPDPGGERMRYVQTYDCELVHPAPYLASHFLHEHMHDLTPSCGYTDADGDTGALPSYEMNRIVEEFLPLPGGEPAPR